MGRDEMAGACHLSLKSRVSSSESWRMNHSRGDLFPAEVSVTGGGLKPLQVGDTPGAAGPHSRTIGAIENSIGFYCAAYCGG